MAHAGRMFFTTFLPITTDEPIVHNGSEGWIKDSQDAFTTRRWTQVPTWKPRLRLTGSRSAAGSA